MKRYEMNRLKAKYLQVNFHMLNYDYDPSDALRESRIHLRSYIFDRRRTLHFSIPSSRLSYPGHTYVNF